jgi:hypothetical protein
MQWQVPHPKEVGEVAFLHHEIPEDHGRRLICMNGTPFVSSREVNKVDQRWGPRRTLSGTTSRLIPHTACDRDHGNFGGLGIWLILCLLFFIEVFSNCIKIHG